MIILSQTAGDTLNHPKRTKMNGNNNEKTIVVGLLGNPNSGKTTIFNALTGSKQKVANWSGVTVEKREGVLKHNGYTVKVVDLPGTYSLSSYSIEEIITRDFIINEHPDVIINIVDAGNLDRNLYLTTQLIDMRTRIVLALNMVDEAEVKGLSINTEILGTLIGMPVIKTIGSKSIGIDDLVRTIIDVHTEKDQKTRHIHINYGADMENEIKKIQSAIREEKSDIKYSSRWLALKLLEGDEDVEKKVSFFVNFQKIFDQVKISRNKMEKLIKDNIETYLSDMRYGFISGAIKESITKIPVKRRDISEKIDLVITNKYLAFPILGLFMWSLFHLTFSIGEYPMHWIERGVELLSHALTISLPEGQLKRLIIDGILGGVGGVIVFLPNILILFMGISFMEDTGYMARAAFKMDRIMHKLGLHGKSFISLVMGFGCNVPAILTARSLENRQDRIITILINPFMSCSARLPVYILFAGAFFREHAGNVIVSLYLIGIVLSFLSARLFNMFFFKGKSTPFVMELPPYRIPSLKSLLMHMWDRGSVYLRKVGGTILVFSIIIWILGEYPKSDEINKTYTERIALMDTTRASEISAAEKKYGIISEEVKHLTAEHKLAKEKILLEKKAEEIKYTCIGRFGDLISPLIKPLGFNWQMGISLTAGFVAKEIVVSTLAVLYHAGDDEQHIKTLRPLGEILTKEENGITPLIAYTFLLFVLLYVPCIGTVVVIAKEAGWSWAAFSIVYQTAVAWTLCFIVYNAGLLAGL